MLPPLVCVVVTSLAGTMPAGRPRFDALGLSAHIAAAVGAGAELVEDFHEVGHGHGMLFLVGSKVARELNTLRESAVESVEDISAQSTVRQFAAFVWQILTCKPFAAALSMLALVAAMLEVISDLSPGGHHGAVLLAVNELSELLVASGLAKGLLLRVLENVLVKLVLVAGAVIFAFAEVLGSGQLKLGGHHGVLVLATAKTLRCIGLLRNAWREHGKEE